MCAAVLDTNNLFKNSPKICIAKSIPYKEYLTGNIKQSGYEYSLLWHPSIFPLDDELLSNLKHCSVKANLAWPKQAAQVRLFPKI